MRRYKSRIRCFYLYRYSSMDGRPRPGLPSGKDCCKQSDPEQFGCPSVLRLLDVYGESETPSTQHRRLRLLRSSKTGEGERKFIFNLVTTPEKPGSYHRIICIPGSTPPVNLRLSSPVITWLCSTLSAANTVT